MSKESQVKNVAGKPTQITEVKGNDTRLTWDVDFVPSSVKNTAYGKAQIVLLEDNEAVIKMTIKCRAPQFKHVARVHRVDLDWLFERVQKDPGLGLKYINTKLQLADILTKGSFTSTIWNQLSALMLIGPPSKTVLPIPIKPLTATMPKTSVDGQSTSPTTQVSTPNVADSKPANVFTPPSSPKIKNP